MIIEMLNRFIWGMPGLILILGVGIFLSFRCGFPQIKMFPDALRLFFSSLGSRDEEKGTTPFRALCTALAATVGTGNLVGVAGAICLGGPGAIFWMWICALVGMATKFAEAALAVRYRTEYRGQYIGGPMYMIRLGLGEKWKALAVIYSLLGIVAAFGVGNAAQINAVVTGINGVVRFCGGRETMTGNLVMGVVLAVLVGWMLLGGGKRIGETAELLVPFASLSYILLCLLVLILRWNAVPAAFGAIIAGAFSPGAVTGGVIGAALQTLRVGVSRGVFTNEAGMGTGSIAHASAETVHPVGQGLMGIVEVFLDTILICTMTALVILVSGVEIPFGKDVGGELTAQAFAGVYGDWVTILLALSLCCFAFATVLGWSFYGVRCCQYLFGFDSWRIFMLFQTAVVIISAVLETGMIWSLSEIVNGLMAIPNMIALVFLSPELGKLTYEYKLNCGR